MNRLLVVVPWDKRQFCTSGVVVGTVLAEWIGKVALACSACILYFFFFSLFFFFLVLIIIHKRFGRKEQLQSPLSSLRFSGPGGVPKLYYAC